MMTTVLLEVQPELAVRTLLDFLACLEQNNAFPSICCSIQLNTSDSPSRCSPCHLRNLCPLVGDGSTDLWFGTSLGTQY